MPPAYTILQDLCRRMPTWAWALVAVVLVSPSLGVGYVADDYHHVATMQGLEPGPVLTELFNFADGDAARNHDRMNEGFLPWHADPELRTRFFRPLTALTHQLDHALAPGVPWVAHAHSLGWFGLLVWVAARLFHRMHGGAVAGLAALLYATHEGHGIPAGWIASRSALLIGVFGLLAVEAWDRWRIEAWQPGRRRALVWLGLAMLSGEGAVAAATMIAAHTLTLAHGSIPERLRTLAPVFGLTALWRGSCGLAGFGAHGSGVYLEPTDLAFWMSLPGRAAMLWADLFLSVPSAMTDFLAGPRTVLILLSTPLALFAAWAMRPLLREPLGRFWFLSLVLATLPAAATMPSNRLLTLMALPGSALIAMLVAKALWASEVPRRRSASMLLGIHLVVGPPALLLGAWSPRTIDDTLFAPCDRVLGEEPVLTEQTAIFLNANEMCTGYLRSRRRVDGRPHPRAVRMLSSALSDVTLTTLDDHTLELELNPGMLAIPAGRLVRAHLAASTVELDDMTVDVLDLDPQGHPTRVRVRFDRRLDDPSFVWVATVERTAERIDLPAVGESRHLPGFFSVP